MKLTSLRFRLILTSVAVIVLGFGGIALFAGRQIETSAREDFEQQTEAQVTLIARGLSNSVEHFMEGETSQAALQELVNGYAEQAGGRVTLLFVSGQPWMDSEAIPIGDDFLVHPEIVAAIDGRTIHETRPGDDDEVRVYSAAPIRHDGSTLSVVSLGVPIDGMARSLQRRWMALGGAVLALTLVAVGVSAWLGSTLTRPLLDLRDTAMQIAQGQFVRNQQADRTDEIGALARAFNRMVGEVESMLDEQRAFASNAAHELRTPLTTIRLRTEALREDLVDPSLAAQYITEIDNEAARLSGLVEDLMLLARLDAGRAQLGRERIDLIRLIDSLINEMQPRCNAKGLTVKTDHSSTPIIVEGGMNHLRVILRNLVDNAIKYTPAGGTITCHVHASDTHAQIVIRDTGQGIAADDLTLVTQRFYRADRAHGRNVPGTGLGLALVQSTLALYGGPLTIESDGPNTGTTVTIHWPLHSRGIDTEQGNPIEMNVKS